MRTGTEKVYWKFPDDVYALTDAQTRQGMSSRLIPEGMRSLVGNGVVAEKLHTVMIVVRDENGVPIGMETEIEVLPGPDEPPVMEVFLTVAIVGRGALFVRELKNNGDPERDQIWAEVKKSGQPWSGEITKSFTVGPLEDRRGIVLAGTGEFEGVTGTQYQTSRLRNVTTESWDNYLCETFDLVWPR